MGNVRSYVFDIHEAEKMMNSEREYEIADLDDLEIEESDDLTIGDGYNGIPLDEGDYIDLEEEENRSVRSESRNINSDPNEVIGEAGLKSKSRGDECAETEISDDDIKVDLDMSDDWSILNRHKLDPSLNYIAEWFADNGYQEVLPGSFYRDIFQKGLLDKKGKKTKEKGIGIATLIQKSKIAAGNSMELSNLGVRFYDDLNDLKAAIKIAINMYESNIETGVSDEFQVLAAVGGCVYFGKECKADNIFMLSAIVIEIDDPISNYDDESCFVSAPYDPIGIKNMLKQMRSLELPSGEIKAPIYPTPTYVVCSGGGIHLYYVLDEPLRLNRKYFYKHYEQVDLFKRCLMTAIWRDQTITKKPIEVQGLAQRYRCVGSPTKAGSIVRAFRLGDRVSLDYLNSFRDNLKYEDSAHHIQECPELSVIVNTAPGTAGTKKPRKVRKGTMGKKAYTNALERIKTNAEEGHRYWFIYCLAATARACSIPKDVLYKDAKSLLEFLDAKTKKNDNHFTLFDMECALKAYDYDGPFMRRTTYESLCGISCPPTKKRNGRSLEEHLEYCRQIKAEKQKKGEITVSGRPLAYWSVLSYRIVCPKARKKDAINAGVASRGTILKYWHLYDVLQENDIQAVENLRNSMVGFTREEVLEGKVPMLNDSSLSIKAYTQQILEQSHLLDEFKNKS